MEDSYKNKNSVEEFSIYNLQAREKKAIRASLISMIVNAVLSFFKIFIAIVTGSIAILADGIDTTTDIITSLLTLIASKISSKPADESHPFGHEPAETIVTKVLSLVIIYAGAQVLKNAIQSLVLGKHIIESAQLVLWISLISMVTKYFLYRYKRSVGEEIKSSSLIADALNMRNDILTSLSVFVGMIFYLLFDITWVDPLVAIMVSLFIFKVGVQMFIETSGEFMGSSRELGEIYTNILEATKKFDHVFNPHKIRVRKSGYVYFVEMHIEVDEKMTIKEANDIASKLEKELKRINPYIKDVIIHVEPLGNKEKEGYGLDEKSIKRIFGNK